MRESTPPTSSSATSSAVPVEDEIAEPQNEDSATLMQDNGFGRDFFKKDEQRLQHIRATIKRTGANATINYENGVDRLAKYVEAIKEDTEVNEV